MWKLAILFDARIKTKKIDHVLEFNQSQWLKPYIEFNSQKRIEAETNNDKDGEPVQLLVIKTFVSEPWNVAAVPPSL